MTDSSSVQRLRKLAGLYGVLTAYRDSGGRMTTASEEALIRTLSALGAPICGLSDLAAAIDDFHDRQVHRLVEPVVVCWDQLPPTLEITVPKSDVDRTLELTLSIFEGQPLPDDLAARPTQIRVMPLSLRESKPIRLTQHRNNKYLTFRVALPVQLPFGYHQGTLRFDSTEHTIQFISAPADISQPGGFDRIWGTFLPLYAFRGEGSDGIGNFSDLRELIRWTHERGGRMVGILPTLASFLGKEAYEYSPYTPASRCFWNEVFLDVDALPEAALTHSQKLTPACQDERNRLRESDLVEYDAVMRLKRARLEAIINDRRFRASEIQLQLQDYLRNHPTVGEYARFRAVVEKQGKPWQVWKPRLQKGDIRAGDYDPKALNYHAYAQWAAERQIGDAYHSAKERGVSLYLDLPLGVNACGWEVFRSREEFTLDASAGAPPDALFIGGQDWAFPPLHPHRIREQCYRTLIRTLRHNMKYADVLRLDHVMGLHRLFTIPHEMTPSDGVYVRYHAEEMYAIICVEAWRSNTAIIGEDLGTVPPETRAAMDRHGFNRMHILQLSLGPSGVTKPNRLSAHSLAALNTHDTAPFAGFWKGKDIDEMSYLNVITSAQAEAFQKERVKQRARLLKGLKTYRTIAIANKSDALEKKDFAAASLEYLAGSSAGIVLVNLEDLWSEDHQQNIPGTWRERPNWRWKMRCRWVEIRDRADILRKLERIDRLRKVPAAPRRWWERRLTGK